MLDCLSVKNYALIKEANIDFKNNLNVLTGETGSGKSILIGSINLALGMRAGKDIMRDENEDTVVSISFEVNDKNIIDELKNMDVNVEDGRIIIYRKITKDKNIVKINDEPSTLNKVREVTEKLIDIYGQHDGEDLRKNTKHIEFIDEFIGAQANNIKKEIADNYKIYKNSVEKFNSFDIDEKVRLREIDILKYEIDEIKNAKLKEGEEEELATSFRLASNSKNIVVCLSHALEILQEANISAAFKEIKIATKYDKELENIASSLMDCDSIISDTVKDIDSKINAYDIDESKLSQMEKRLDCIRGIISKYDNSVVVALKECDDKQNRLVELEDYENQKKKAKNLVDSHYKKLLDSCEKLSVLRKENAKIFESKIVDELKDLGFLDVKFEIDIEKKEEITKNGYDEVVFKVSLNPGEKLRPLSEVASGGELSRIMLSIKTILSDNIGTESLIFDEIDAGISGITASKVATKLNKIAKKHQVILITHLPQIAAMADNHFIIRKKANGDRTLTSIETLSNKGMIEEIGRLISTDGKLSDNVLANAKELKDNAMKEKK